MNATQRMIERVEYLKAGYAALIEEGVRYEQDTEIEFHQWQRMNTLLGYLEERVTR